MGLKRPPANVSDNNNNNNNKGEFDHRRMTNLSFSNEDDSSDKTYDRNSTESARIMAGPLSKLPPISLRIFTAISERPICLTKLRGLESHEESSYELNASEYQSHKFKSFKRKDSPASIPRLLQKHRIHTTTSAQLDMSIC